MLSRKKQILLTLLVWFATVCMAQISRFERCGVSYMDITTGLPNNFVNDIYSDSYGFVWIATHGGLTRYDGYTYLYLSTGSKVLQLKSNSCRNMVEDGHHRLWVSFDEGTNVIDLTTMRCVVPTVKQDGIDMSRILAERSVRTYTDSKGCLWLVTMSHIYRFAFDKEGRVASALTYAYVGNTPDVIVSDLDQDGQVWVGINSLLVKLAVRQGRLQAIRRNDVVAQTGAAYISDIVKYQGRIWAGTNNGLYAFTADGKALDTYRHTRNGSSLSHDFVSCLQVIDGKDLLVGTYGGVNILKSGQDGFYHWATNDPAIPLGSNFVHCIYSAHNNIWVGTESGGITKLSPRELILRNYTHDRNALSLSPNAVNAMLVDRQGGLWVGTVEGGLNIKRAGNTGFEHIDTANSHLTHNSVSALTSDAQDHLWIGTWGGGVNTTTLGTPSAVVPLSVPTPYRALLNFVGVLEYDAINDGVWIGSNDGIFFYNLRTGAVEDPFPGCRNIRGCVGSVVTRRGMLYVGCLEGMIEVNLRSRTSVGGAFAMKHYRYKLDNQQSGIIDKLCCFYETNDGTLWLGSNGYGLYRQVVNRDGSVGYQCYTTEDGLPNNSVKGIVEDDKGLLWVTTDYGLARLDPKSGVVTNYTENDGLVSSQFYYNSAVRAPNGTLYFGTIEGLVELLGESSSHIYKGNLRFTGLSIDQRYIGAGTRFLDKDISIARRLDLRESDKSFTIEFSALNYGSETQGVYSYRMKGFEDDWIQLPPGQHSVRYTSLPAGSYTFEVRYTSTFDGEKGYIALDVHVTPYFWKSWWFVSLVLIVLAIFTYYAYHWRVQQLKEQEAEKLYRPIEAALKESEAPGMLQIRIQSILDNEKRYKESQEKSVRADREAMACRTRPFMEQAMEVMEARFADSEFGPTELGDALGLSRSLLNKKLGSELGFTANQFIRNYRLEFARKLIVENSLGHNITEIAYRSGFNDPKYFTRCFTKQYGVSPSSYKEKH